MKSSEDLEKFVLSIFLDEVNGFEDTRLKDSLPVCFTNVSLDGVGCFLSSLDISSGSVSCFSSNSFGLGF